MMTEFLQITDDPRITDGSQWVEVVSAISDLQKLVYDDPRVDTPILRAEGLRYLTRLLTGGIPMTLEAWDFDYPSLFKFISPHMQFGLVAADCCYNWAAVHGDGVYRLKGRRGTCRIFDVETRSGHIANLGQWTLHDRGSDFTTGPDGEIEVVLSATEQPGNWIRIPEGPGTVIVRQYYYDWLTEEPAVLSIERDGVRYPPPPLTPTDMSQRLDLLVAWIRTLGFAMQVSTAEHYAADPGALAFTPIDYAWADILYGKGHYRCGPDEAVLLEVTPPQAQYWNIQLTSHYLEGLDFHLRQTSINGHQAVIDDDGVFRAVISHTDPGVPNWLDAGGHVAGLVTARYYLGESTPVPTLRTIPLSSVRDELPASTPEVTDEQRQDALRARHRSIIRRGI